MRSMLEALIGSALLGLIVPFVAVNVWHWRRRKMTPYERAIEEANLRYPGDW